MTQLQANTEVLFIDGECVFCNKIVLWALTKKRLNHIKFSTLQGEYFQQIIRKVGGQGIPDSVVFYHNEKLLYKSEAVFALIRELGRFQSVFMFTYSIIPLFIRNWVYDRIAKNRHNWFGKTSAFCKIPSIELKERTIS